MNEKTFYPTGNSQAPCLVTLTELNGAKKKFKKFF
jgi:hypothetical protein